MLHALSSAITELIARFLGLRGAYLLSGLRELLDDGQTSLVLSDAEDAYTDIQKLMRPGAVSHDPPPSVTGALLGGPILGSQGHGRQYRYPKVTLEPDKQAGRLPRMTAGGRGWSLWSQRRSLPSYISDRSAVPLKAWTLRLADLGCPCFSLAAM